MATRQGLLHGSDVSGYAVTVVRFPPHMGHLPFVVWGGLNNAVEYLKRHYDLAYLLPLPVKAKDVEYEVRYPVAGLTYQAELWVKFGTLEVKAADLNVSDLRAI